MTLKQQSLLTMVAELVLELLPNQTSQDKRKRQELVTAIDEFQTEDTGT